jgi:hypothetical protein
VIRIGHRAVYRFGSRSLKKDALAEEAIVEFNAGNLIAI